MRSEYSHLRRLGLIHPPRLTVNAGYAPPDGHFWAVAALVAAGAILLATIQMDELGVGVRGRAATGARRHIHRSLGGAADSMLTRHIQWACWTGQPAEEPVMVVPCLTARACLPT